MESFKSSSNIDSEKEAEVTDKYRKNFLLALTPAILVALSACSENVSDSNIESILQEGGYIEVVSADDLEFIKASIPALKEQYGEQTKFIPVKSEDGRTYTVYLPEGNILVISRDYTLEGEKPDYYSRERDISYSFANPDATVRKTGLLLASDDSLDSRSLLQNSSKGPVVTYSQMNDFGSKRTYEIGQKVTKATPVMEGIAGKVAGDRQLLERLIK